MNQNPQNFNSFPDPGQPPYGFPPVPPQTTSGMAIAGMILGIVSIEAVFVQTFVGLVCAILGLVFSVIAKKECNRTGRPGRGMATAGLVCSIIGLVLFVILLVFALWIIQGFYTYGGSDWF